MLERLILAAIITFCIYLSLNLRGQSHDRQSLDTPQGVIPEIISKIVSFSW